MKKPIFEGMATALVTPITEKGIDYEAFGKLIDWQIEEGISGLVICGTTGEGSTLTDEEHIKKMNLLLEHLEDNDDVQNVYHNWEMTE